MFGYWNIPPIKPTPKLGCDSCTLYHGSKFSGWKCACECHEEKQPTPKQHTIDLDWDESEEITQPYGT